MNLLVGSLSMGLLLSLLALGVLVTYRVLDTIDLTVDGSFGVGAAVAAALLVGGTSPVAATLAGAAAGIGAGLATGVMHTGLGVNLLIAGVLTSTALYSAQLFVMGGGDLSIASRPTVFTIAEHGWARAGGSPEGVTLFGTAVSAASWAALALLALLALGATLVLDWFFRTHAGLSMRATGDNPQMARAQGVGVAGMVVLGLALANGMIGLAGALFAQYQGFANIQMGIGMIVTGLACLILGETVFGGGGMSRRLAGAVGGTVLFRLLVSAALRLGLNPNALKLVTALLVLVALGLPLVLRPRLPARSRGRVTADV